MHPRGCPSAPKVTLICIFQILSQEHADLLQPAVYPVFPRLPSSAKSLPLGAEIERGHFLFLVRHRGGWLRHHFLLSGADVARDPDGGAQVVGWYCSCPAISYAGVIIRSKTSDFAVVCDSSCYATLFGCIVKNDFQVPPPSSVLAAAPKRCLFSDYPAALTFVPALRDSSLVYF